jgi:broad specificity phosphatase PhoE
MADALHLFGPLPLYTSPLRRCQETADALARRWGIEPTIDEGVGEVESPTTDLASRGEWLRGLMRGTWDEQAPDVLAWRRRVIETLIRLGDDDAVICSHFIAINVAVGEAMGDRRVVNFAPDNCSRTELKVEGGRLEVVELGGQARTVVR